MKKVVDKNAMKSGYIQMGALNLQISQEDYHLEQEGEQYYGMETSYTEGNAE